jgi:NAD(P)-dependent dehydrogenase (short-subunit alcohol dehydrogenase family)
MSKIALEGLANILAEELSGSGRVRVHTFIPGPFRSPVHLKAFPGGDRQVLPDASALGTSLAELLSHGCRLPNGPIGPGLNSSPYSNQTGETHHVR